MSIESGSTNSIPQWVKVKATYCDRKPYVKAIRENNLETVLTAGNVFEKIYDNPKPSSDSSTMKMKKTPPSPSRRGFIIGVVDKKFKVKNEGEEVKKLYQMNPKQLISGDMSKISDDICKKITLAIDSPQELYPEEPNGKSYYDYNTDLVLIAGVYQQDLQKFKGNDTPAKKSSVTRRDPRITVPGLIGIVNKDKQGKAMISKGAACVKSAFLSEKFFSKESNEWLFKIKSENSIGLCFLGHWCPMNENVTNSMSGEHIVPHSEILKRFDNLDPEFKAHDLFIRYERLLKDYALYDAKSFVPICMDCQGKYFNNCKTFQAKVQMLLGADLYGKEFFEQYLGKITVNQEGNEKYLVNYQDNWVVPRTRQGYGIGDAMMFHVFWNFERNTLNNSQRLSSTTQLIYTKALQAAGVAFVDDEMVSAADLAEYGAKIGNVSVERLSEGIQHAKDDNNRFAVTTLKIMQILKPEKNGSLNLTVEKIGTLISEFSNVPTKQLIELIDKFDQSDEDTNSSDSLKTPDLDG